MTRNSSLLQTARNLLEDVSPLTMDCGDLCGRSCCADSEDGMNGMLLFLGEEELPLPAGATLLDTSYRAGDEKVFLMTCPGSCDRSARPLACRIFPLIIWPKKTGDFSLRMDERGRFCPLHDSGQIGLCPEFRNAVHDVFALFWKDPRQRAFLEMLGEEQRELKRLRGLRWGSTPDPAQGTFVP